MAKTPNADADIVQEGEQVLSDAEQFLVDGKARIERALAPLDQLAIAGLPQVMAIKHVIANAFAELLNHISGTPAPIHVPEERDDLPPSKTSP